MQSAMFVHIIDNDPEMEILKDLKEIAEAANLRLQIHESAGDFLDSVRIFQPGCLILSLNALGVDSFAFLQQLRANQCEIPVIAVTRRAEFADAVSCMKLGAIDVLLKPFEPEVLLSILRKAIQASIDIHERHSKAESVRHRFAALTARERELLKLVAAGWSNKQIASALKISIKTVANHRSHLLAKTAATNAADLSRLSTIAGFVTAD